MISSTTQVLYESSTLFTELPASTQAKCVAERFISTFSNVESSPHWKTSHNFEIISLEDREILKSTLTPNVIKYLKEGDIPKSSSFYLVGRGYNHHVWGHISFPHIVIKLMSQDCAHRQIHVAKRAHEVVQTMKNCLIQIPRVSFVDTGEITAYIEERLPIGLDDSQHKEFWARILIHYQSSECSYLFKEHLQELIGHIQHLILRIGFWDVGYKNLPEVRLDGTGVCATDFEQIDEEDALKIATGLQRLAHLFPVAPLVDSIITGNKQQMSLVNFFNTIKFHEEFDPNKPWSMRIHQEFYAKLEKNKESLEVLQEVIQINDKRGYVNGDEEILSCCDLSLLDTNEKAIAQKLLLVIRRKHSAREGTTLSERRSLDLELGVGDNTFPSYERERFLKVLNFLKGQNIIIAWSDDYKIRVVTKSLKYVNYKIYF